MSVERNTALPSGQNLQLITIDLHKFIDERPKNIVGRIPVG
nr:hypothetical protein [Haliscomenobacter sp.]